MKRLGRFVECPLCGIVVGVVQSRSGVLGLASHRGRTCRRCPAESKDSRVQSAIVSSIERGRVADAIERILSTLRMSGSHSEPEYERRFHARLMTALYGDPRAAETEAARIALVKSGVGVSDHFDLVDKPETGARITGNERVLAAMFGGAVRFLASPELWAFVMLNRAEEAEQRGANREHAPRVAGSDEQVSIEERVQITSNITGYASTVKVLAAIDAADDKRELELAILIFAEACAHLTTDPRVAECRKVRLSWVRGEADDEQRAAAMAAAMAAWDDADSRAARAVWSAATDDAWSAEWAALKAAEWNGVAWDAARDAIANPLRTLYPDPTRIDYRDALTRWDVAVAQAHALTEFHMEAK